MIDAKQFSSMEKEIKVYDEKREELIKTMRDVLKLSKQIIYACHRSELDKAKRGISQCSAIVSDVNKGFESEPRLEYEGSYRAAMEEFVEAQLYYYWLKDHVLASPKKLSVSTMHYIYGLCDLPGELTRRAIHAATDGRTDEVLPIRNLTEEIYQILLQFDIRGGDLRKKFDQIKYDLRRLDDMAFQLKVNGKL